jgi:hypothetical protein
MQVPGRTDAAYDSFHFIIALFLYTFAKVRKKCDLDSVLSDLDR